MQTGILDLIWKGVCMSLLSRDWSRYPMVTIDSCVAATCFQSGRHQETGR